jgi:hypothetical protein
LHGQASTIEVLPELGRHPLLSIALANVDNHRHEEAGVENDSVKLRDPVVARQALQNLLQANPGAFPVIITFQIIRAIEGNTHPARKTQLAAALSDIEKRIAERKRGAIMPQAAE